MFARSQETEFLAQSTGIQIVDQAWTYGHTMYRICCLHITILLALLEPPQCELLSYLRLGLCKSNWW